MQQFDTIIAGGGLAGLTAAIKLAQAGLAVAVLEKASYPRHKVCGEYVSNEVLPYLNRLGIFPIEAGAKKIDKLEISAPSGSSSRTFMAMGGFGISRYAFDHMIAKRARDLGVVIKEETSVEMVNENDGAFIVATRKGEEFLAKQVIGAHGKRSKLDKQLERTFIHNRSTYIGVKHHFEGSFPDDKVALHNFEGGYCGLSKVENDRVNVCYLTTTDQFKNYPSLEAFEKQHLSQNPHLRHFFEQAHSCFDPLVISQVSFEPKLPVEKHILMCGDSAGLISPLCGNGMAMAIHAGKMCADWVMKYLKETIDRPAMERGYAKDWRNQFVGRLKFGKRAQRLFGKPLISEFSIQSTRLLPGLLPALVKRSHGSKI